MQQYQKLLEKKWAKMNVEEDYVYQSEKLKQYNKPLEVDACKVTGISIGTQTRKRKASDNLVFMAGDVEAEAEPSCEAGWALKLYEDTWKSRSNLEIPLESAKLVEKMLYMTGAMAKFRTAAGKEIMVFRAPRMNVVSVDEANKRKAMVRGRPVEQGVIMPRHVAAETEDELERMA